MSKSNIEWTGHTWNPIAGCSLKSPGCTRCYAMTMARRIEAMDSLPHYAGLTKVVNGHAVWTGKIALAPDSILLQPLQRKKPTTYFVNSMSDLFHEDVPDEWIDRIFAIMALAPQHTFQVLTKRSARMRQYLFARNGMGNAALCDAINAIPSHLGNRHGALEMPLPNVWLGVSCEDQQRAEERIPDLLATPAAIRFISAEPLIGPISLRWAKWDDWNDPDGNRRPTVDHLDGARMLDWVIAGGESGPGARPMNPDWVRELRAQCAEAGIAFFFKQWGAHLPVGQVLPGCGKVHGATAVRPGRMKLHCGGSQKQDPRHVFAERGVEFTSMDDGRLTFRVGKKAAGRLLDGREHNGMPGAAS